MRPPTGIMTGQSLWMMPTRRSPGMSAAVGAGIDAGHGQRRARVDGHDVGAGVGAEVERCMTQSVGAKIVDEVLVAQCQVGTLVAGTTLPQARGQADRRLDALRQVLHHVEDLRVAHTRHRWAPRWRAAVSRSSEEPFLSSRALTPPAKTSMPGVQNPHWSAPVAAKAAARRARSSSGRPSSVVTSLPSARSRPTWHNTTALIRAAPCSTRTAPKASSRPWATPHPVRRAAPRAGGAGRRPPPPPCRSP